MTKKKLIASLEHPVVLYCCLNFDDPEEHERAVDQWEKVFTEVLGDGEESVYRYDRVIFLTNVNIKAYCATQFGIDRLVHDLPVLHAGVVFMRGEYPTWMYLFEDYAGMDQMMAEHPYNNFVTPNGKLYLDEARARGIKFDIFNGKEALQHASTPDDTRERIKGLYIEEELDGLTTVRQEELPPINSICSLPGWPSREVRQIAYDMSVTILRQMTSGMPEPLKDLILKGSERGLVKTPIIYRIPLPGNILYEVNHVTMMNIHNSDYDGQVVLIQNDHALFD